MGFSFEKSSQGGNVLTPILHRSKASGAILALGINLFGFMLVTQQGALGQGASARLTGQVVDPTGAAIPGVVLAIEETATGSRRTTLSNELGYYTLDGLSRGTYKLTAKAEGFAEAVVSPIVLQVNQVANVGVTLKPGEVLQEITVAATEVALETQTSSLGGVVNEQVTRQLPLILRDPTQLVNLVPGVTADHRKEKGTFAGPLGGLTFQTRLAFTVSGGFRGQAAALVDGIDVSVTHATFNTMPIVPTPDFTQEFKLQTNNLSAQFGRGAGVLNIVTRSGTNKFHGSVFEFLQNDNINANDFFLNSRGQPKTESRRNQYGFAVGGPIRRDKTWFFTDWEEFRQGAFLPIFTRVPSEAERRGDFSNLYNTAGRPISIYNPFDTFTDVDGRVKRRVFPDNQIPANLMNGYAVKLLDWWGRPNNPGLRGPSGEPTQVGNFAVGATQALFFKKNDVKVDHNIGTSHRFMGRYSQSNFYVQQVNVFNNAALSSDLSSRENRQPGNNAVLSWTWVVSPSLVITQAGNYSRFTDDARNPSLGFDTTPLGGPFADGRIAEYARQNKGGTTFPYNNVAGYASLGTSPTTSFFEPHNNYAYQLGIVKTRGRHVVSTGLNFTVMQVASNFSTGGVGRYDWTANFTQGPDPLLPTPNTGVSLADVLLGTFTTATFDTGYSAITSNKRLGAYIQDDIRVTSRLTLNLGLRYELERPFRERYNQVSLFDLDVPAPVGEKVGPNTGGRTLNQYFTELTGRPLRGGLIFPSSPLSHGRGIQLTNWRDFSPRAGFAYQISSKLVMRGGLGKLFMLSPLTPTVETPNGTLTTLTVTPGTIDGIRPFTTIANPYPNGFSPIIRDTQGLDSLLGRDVIRIGSRGGKTPYQWQWNVGFQYELPGSSLVSVTYAGSRGRRLQCAFFNVCGDQLTHGDLQRAGGRVLESVPNPFFGVITDPTSALSRPTVQRGRLFKQFPHFFDVGFGLPTWQGGKSFPFRNTWDSLQVQVQKQFSHDLNLVVAYTLSKNITNTDSFESGFLGPFAGYQDRFSLAGERALSAEDVPQRLAVGYIYDLPIGKGKAIGANLHPAGEKILGGWQVSGITTLASGFPLRPTVTPNSTGTFGGGARPNASGGYCMDAGRPRGERINNYVNAAAFSFPAPFTYGSAPRLLPNCRADGIKNTDFSVIKFIPLLERLKPEFRAEFFNIFNRTQFAPPNMVFGSPSFGRATTTYNSARIIQLGLKINF
jgi:hypothetical protein